MAASYAVAKPLWFLFITAACMRLLTPEGYGVFTASLALALLTSSIGDLGTGRYTIREVARQPRMASRLFSNLLVGRIVLAAIGLLLALVVAVALGYSRPHVLAVLAAGLYAVAFRGAEYCRSVFQAFEVLHFEALLTVLEKVAVVLLGVVLLFWFGNPAMAFVGMAAGMAAVFGVHLWYVIKRFAPFRSRLLSPSYITRTIRRALPLGAISVLSVVPLGATPVIVDAYLGNEAAGLYGGAQRVVEAMWMLIAIVMTAVFPRFSSLYHKRQITTLRRLTNATSLGLLGIGLIAALFVSIFSETIILLLTASDAYLESAPLLSALAWVFPFTCIWMMSLQLLIAMDQNRFGTFSAAAGAVSCVSLSVVLIPFIGMWGAVIAYSSTWVITSFLNMYRCLTVLRNSQDVPSATPVPYSTKLTT